MTPHIRRLMRLISLSVSILVVGGCSIFLGPPFDPNLKGQEVYLCCTTRFSTGFAASDANYGRYYAARNQYAKGPVLPAGTKVTVTEVRAAGVTFHPNGSPLNYNIEFGYGKGSLSPTAYFAKILLPTDPMASIVDSSPTLTAEIVAGQLKEGMTREQALMARGYPPAHRTPDLNANQWMYYDTPGMVDRVTFVDGKISSITPGRAPD